MNKSRTPRQQAFIDFVVILPPIIPFALLVGVSVLDFNFPLWYATLSSLTIFAGAAQIAQLHALYNGESIWLSIFIVAVINSRQLMYSASLAPVFSGLSSPKRLGLAYFLTDQAYAFTLLKGHQGYSRAQQIDYYTTFSISVWIAWQLATIAGLYVGKLLPTTIPTTAVIPLLFLSMAALSITNRAHIISFTVGALVAVIFDYLPYRTGLLVGALTGIACGVAWDIKQGRLNAR